jgi:vacuolar-type H+-ATPase subunit F/Vma7
VSGFKALGFKVYAAKQAEECSAMLDKAVSEKPAVCLVQDNLYQAMETQINSYRHLALPVFIPFAKDAGTALLDSIVRDIRLRATGTF